MIEEENRRPGWDSETAAEVTAATKTSVRHVRVAIDNDPHRVRSLVAWMPAGEVRHG